MDNDDQDCWDGVEEEEAEAMDWEQLSGQEEEIEAAMRRELDMFMEQGGAELEDQLCNACLKNDVEEVRRLLAAKALPNGASGKPTPLVIACSNQSPEIVRLLIIAGAVPTLSSPGQWVEAPISVTPLQVAIKSRNLTVLETLLSCRSVVACITSRALQEAIDVSWEDGVQLILSRASFHEDLLAFATEGALLRMRDSLFEILLNKLTCGVPGNLIDRVLELNLEAMLIAIVKKYPDAVTIEHLAQAITTHRESSVMVLLMVDAGISRFEPPGHSSLLNLAVSSSTPIICEALILKGAPVNPPYGRHPLQVAVAFNRPEMIALLFEFDATPNFPYLLAMAVHKAREPVLAELFRHGAGVAFLGEEGEKFYNDLLSQAVEQRESTVVVILLGQKVRIPSLPDLLQKVMKKELHPAVLELLKMGVEVSDPLALINMAETNPSFAEPIISYLLQREKYDVQTLNTFLQDAVDTCMGMVKQKYRRIQILISYGAQCSSLTNRTSMVSFPPKLLDLMLKEGLRVNQPVKLWQADPLHEGDRLIHLAINNPRLIRVLVANKADLNIGNSQGLVPLYHAACIKRHFSVVHELLRSGADPVRLLPSSTVLGTEAGPIIAQRAVAMVMSQGSHPRLGSESPLQLLPHQVLLEILSPILGLYANTHEFQDPQRGHLEPLHTCRGAWLAVEPMNPRISSWLFTDQLWVECLSESSIEGWSSPVPAGELLCFVNCLNPKDRERITALFSQISLCLTPKHPLDESFRNMFMDCNDYLVRAFGSVVGPVQAGVCCCLLGSDQITINILGPMKVCVGHTSGQVQLFWHANGDTAGFPHRCINPVTVSLPKAGVSWVVIGNAPFWEFWKSEALFAILSGLPNNAAVFGAISAQARPSWAFGIWYNFH